MFTFLNPKISGFGIDLNDLSIKLISLEKKGDEFQVVSFNRLELNEGIIEQGEIKKEDELIAAIQKTIKEAKGKKIRTKYCVVSLPETVAFIQTFKMPRMEKGELAEAIKWELEARVPLSRDEIYYDWQVIEPLEKNTTTTPADQIDVLLGVLPKKTVDPYFAVLKKAGLKPFLFEIDSVATARALIKKGSSPEPLIIVDFGAKRTNLLIFSGRTVFFTTSLSISNSVLVDTLSQQLKITKEKAKKIKINVGLDINHPKSGVFPALEPSLKELIKQIQGYLTFFQERHEDTKKISRIILCGGGAQMADLPEFLSQELGLPVEIGNPKINLFKEPREIPGLPQAEILSYTTAIGLALRGQRSKL